MSGPLAFFCTEPKSGWEAAGQHSSSTAVFDGGCSQLLVAVLAKRKSDQNSPQNCIHRAVGPREQQAFLFLRTARSL